MAMLPCTSEHIASACRVSHHELCCWLDGEHADKDTVCEAGAAAVVWCNGNPWKKRGGDAKQDPSNDEGLPADAVLFQAKCHTCSPWACPHGNSLSKLEFAPAGNGIAKDRLQLVFSPSSSSSCSSSSSSNSAPAFVQGQVQGQTQEEMAVAVEAAMQAALEQSKIIQATAEEAGKQARMCAEREVEREKVRVKERVRREFEGPANHMRSCHR
jgi:hypothetical protein